MPDMPDKRWRGSKGDSPAIHITASRLQLGFQIRERHATSQAPARLPPLAHLDNKTMPATCLLPAPCTLHLLAPVNLSPPSLELDTPWSVERWISTVPPPRVAILLIIQATMALNIMAVPTATPNQFLLALTTSQPRARAWVIMIHPTGRARPTAPIPHPIALHSTL